MRRRHEMPFGATLLAGGGASFGLWAPTAGEVVLELQDNDRWEAQPMAAQAGGWHCLTVAQAQRGQNYRYRLPDGLCVPDPASRANPQDVHGPSQLVDPLQHEWQDGSWHGRPWAEAVVYELHIGTFTDEGTFAAAAARLPELARLGITAIELMPLADFPGRRNWGYDGVLHYAPDAAYGTPQELKALIETAHALGLMMLIDVVYNHFGPEGNYLHAYCPEFFNPAHPTPWGAAINFDGEHSRTVRDFYIHNALYWVEEYHFDGLRMDAIHAIYDHSDRHIVQEICAALRDGPGRTRHVHVVLENDANQASFLTRAPDGMGLAGTAQWNDDLHHAVHVLATGETDGYYADYAHAPVEQLGRALAQGFVYQGQASPFRQGQTRGEPSDHLPSGAFVSFLQTHDQVGNRALGERIHALGDEVLVKAACSCLLLSPHVPMLFMGEEYAATTPFQFFCDFGPELAQAVSKGRLEEFGKFAAFSSEQARASIPDPNAESTFMASKLRWEERDRDAHRSWLEQVRALLAVRREWLVPRLSGQRQGGISACEGETLQVQWSLGAVTAGGPDQVLHLLAHFGQDRLDTVAAPPGRVIYSAGVDSAASELRLSRGAVHATLEGAEHV